MIIASGSRQSHLFELVCATEQSGLLSMAVFVVPIGSIYSHGYNPWARVGVCLDNGMSFVEALCVLMFEEGNRLWG